jgi:hypothetical protein
MAVAVVERLAGAMGRGSDPVRRPAQPRADDGSRQRDRYEGGDQRGVARSRSGDPGEELSDSGGSEHHVGPTRTTGPLSIWSDLS